MTLEELKQQYPGLYLSFVEEGTNEGVQQERQRCLGTLPKGSVSPAMQYALQCIKDGSPLGCRQIANYQSLLLREEQQAETVVSLVERHMGVNRDEPDRH